MSFTVDSARERAERLIDEDIEEVDAVSWANEFIRKKMTTEHWPEKDDDESYKDAAANTWLALPTDFVEIIDVTGPDDNPYTDYKIRSGKIRFDKAGSYTLSYRALPSVLTSINGEGGTPLVHDLFELPMSKFMASRQRSKDDSEDADSVRWLSECESDLAGIFVKLQTQEEPPRIVGRW